MENFYSWGEKTILLYPEDENAAVVCFFLQVLKGRTYEVIDDAIEADFRVSVGKPKNALSVSFGNWEPGSVELPWEGLVQDVEIKLESDTEEQHEDEREHESGPEEPD